MVSQDYIDKVNAALVEACPLASNDPESIAALKDRIQKFGLPSIGRLMLESR